MEDRKFDMNIDGRGFEKTLVPQKAYEAVITKIGDIREFPTFIFKMKQSLRFKLLKIWVMVLLLSALFIYHEVRQNEKITYLERVVEAQASFDANLLSCFIPRTMFNFSLSSIPKDANMSANISIYKCGQWFNNGHDYYKCEYKNEYTC